MKGTEAAALTAWAFGILAALLVAIFGTLALALCKGGNAPPTCVETRRCERCESGAEAECCGPAAGCGADHERTKPLPPPRNPLPPLVIDLNVNTVAAPTTETGSTGPTGSGGGITTQTATVNGVPVAPASGDGNGATTQSVVVNVPPPATTAGGSGRDVVVLFDREKTVEKPPETGCRREKDRCGGEKPRPPCADGNEPDGGPEPRNKAVKLGHVEFEHGSRRFVPSHPDLIGGILEELGGRTGPLLVVGHGDRCGQRRLAERRAKKARRELRRLLKKRLAWKNGDIRVHSQAAGVGLGALEGRCTAELYRSAGVYLIEDLS